MIQYEQYHNIEPIAYGPSNLTIFIVSIVHKSLTANSFPSTSEAYASKLLNVVPYRTQSEAYASDLLENKSLKS